MLRIFLLVSTCFLLRVDLAVQHDMYSPAGTCSKDNKNQCEGEAPASDDEGPSMIGRVAKLTRWDPVKVGHKRQIDLGDQVRTMTTLAMKPPLFKIPDFLSGEECEHIIKLALKTNMISSLARGGLTTQEELEVPTIASGQADTSTGEFSNWDYDGDDKITLEEALEFCRETFYLHLKKDDLLATLHKVDVFELDDGIITPEEFETMNTLGIDGIMYSMGLKHPRHRPRYSDQTWLNPRGLQDSVLNTIVDRVIKLTNLSSETVYGSERIQVVRYDKHGHYHAHHDSETHTRTEVPCCHHRSEVNAMYDFDNPCRICRYVTILYYLNNVQAGGETAFPVADNETLDISNLQNSRGELDYYNLSHNCHVGNLVIPPKRGTAIMWYNHLLDEESGWMGAMDDYSLHGGCDIHEGIKWIANNWITASYKEDADKKSVWLEFYD